MQNVFTGRLLSACMSATTSEESMPPGQKCPQGHIGDHAQIHRAPQQRIELAEGVVHAADAVGRPGSAASRADQ